MFYGQRNLYTSDTDLMQKISDNVWYKWNIDYTMKSEPSDRNQGKGMLLLGRGFNL